MDKKNYVRTYIDPRRISDNSIGGEGTGRTHICDASKNVRTCTDSHRLSDNSVDCEDAWRSICDG